MACSADGLPVVVTAPNPSEQKRRRARHHRCGAGGTAERLGSGARSRHRRDRCAGAPISGLIRSVFSCCGPRDEEPTIVPFSCTPTVGSNLTTVPASSALQTVRVRLADHVARDRRRTAAETALERITRCDEPDDADQTAASPMFEILMENSQTPRSTSTIFPVERACRERRAAVEVAARTVAVLQSPPGRPKPRAAPTTAGTPPGRCRRCSPAPRSA